MIDFYDVLSVLLFCCMMTVAGVAIGTFLWVKMESQP